MALVAYDNSDSSEYEDDDNENVTVITLNKQDEKTSNENEELSTDNNVLNSEGNLFNLLPQPSSKRPSVIEEDDEFLHKKENLANVAKPKAKITVPSLNDFKDVENRPSNAKPRSVNSKCGLLSILPQPRNGFTVSTKTLIPNVLTQKSNNSNFKKKEPIPQKFLKKTKVDIKPLINDYSDESDNEQVENDFFSINKPAEIIKEAPVELDQESINNPSLKKTFNVESYFKVDTVEDHIEQDDLSGGSSCLESVEENSSYGKQEPDWQSNEAVLDEDAIMKLCGTRGKRKREEIEIVDIDQKEVLADAKEWLLKGLMDDTTKRVSASKKKGHEPTNQQKRKHQITYLAYQAKANEADLQNQWANNRMSKRQTQSKYGF